MRIVLGTIKAHYLDVGDPPWLFVVAPPGTGKTTMSIMSACGLPEVIQLGDLSENTFLSGFYQHKTPGLLEKLGPVQQNSDTFITNGNAIILVKDFTTVLSMRREKRGVILSQLREIHDGEFKRDFGTGETKIWRGRVTVIAAVTPVLDRHYSIFSTLGERFLQVRWRRPDSPEAGEWAIRQQGHESEIQRLCKGVITTLFQQSTSTAPLLADGMVRRIAAIAEVVSLSRTHVFRNSYGDREIEYVPEAEANTRISKGLAAIARGIAALNHREKVTEEDLQDAFRVALDCIPDSRRQVLVATIAGKAIDSLPLPRTVRERAIEELRELRLLTKDSPPKLTDSVASLRATAQLCPDLFGTGDEALSRSVRDGSI
ncbi:MAG: hypothetical protein HY644_01645 [Acidobacteria bacterium]|nr:hypothetical protein [Acidobacteriota bacterium]